MAEHDHGGSCEGVDDSIMECGASNESAQEKSQEIKVLFFARAREIVGLSDTTLKINDRHGLTTITDCVEHITQQFPGLQEISSCMLVALNQEYADGSSTVKDGDELALIPPISGG